MIVLDASVVVSLVVPQDVHYGPTSAWLAGRLRAGEGFAAPLLLPLEVAGAIARRTGSATTARAAVAWLYRLRGLRLVPLDARLAQQATDLAVTLRLRGADALYVAVARELDIPLVSWDAEHLTRAAPVISVLSPA